MALPKWGVDCLTQRFHNPKESAEPTVPEPGVPFIHKQQWEGFLRYLMIDFQILIERPDNLYSESACPAIN